MKKYTIYQFENLVNGKKYIGITGIKYPSMRKGQHLFNLRKISESKRNKPLSAAQLNALQKAREARRARLRNVNDFS